MPTYDFTCSKCNHSFERILPISRIDEPLESPCPSCNESKTITRVVGAPALGDSVRLGIRKIDNGFKEVLQKIHERSPGSKLKDNI